MNMTELAEEKARRNGHEELQVRQLGGNSGRYYWECVKCKKQINFYENNWFGSALDDNCIDDGNFKLMVSILFKKGDRVKLHSEALLHHARSVPANHGYTRADFAWRGWLRELKDEIGIVRHAFDSGLVNVQYGDRMIYIDHKSLVQEIEKEEVHEQSN